MPDIFDEVDEVKPDVFDEIESERESLRGQMREARAEAIGNKALTGLSNIGERIGYTAALLGAKADPTGVVHNMLAREGYEVPSVIPPGFLEPDVRTVSKFAREGLGNFGIRPGPVPPEIERPLTEFAAENIAGLAEAAPQLVLGKFQPRPVARYFQGQMAAGLQPAIEQAVQAETPEEKLKTGLQVTANVAFPAAIESGLRKQPIRIPDIPGSVLRMPEGAEPRIEPPPAIDIGPKPSPPRPLPEIKSIASETGVPEETVAKGIRVEAEDHPEVAKSNPELLPTLVKDELKLDKAAYDKDADPAKESPYSYGLKEEKPISDIGEMTDYEKGLRQSLASFDKPFHPEWKETNPAGFIQEEISRLQRKKSILEELGRIPRTLESIRNWTRAEVETAWHEGRLTDKLFYEYAKEWNKTPRFGNKMREEPLPPETPEPTPPPPSPEAQAKPAAAPTERTRTTGTVDDFDRLASLQREDPESAMLKIGRRQISQLYAWAAEHVGDLTNRIAKDIKSSRGMYETVKDKVERTLRDLRDNFDLAVRQQVISNFRFEKSEKTGRFEEYQKWQDAFQELRQLGQAYADAHKKLPVINEAQRVANRAAIALGEMRYEDAIKELTQLKEWLNEGREAWEKRVSEGLVEKEPTPASKEPDPAAPTEAKTEVSEVNAKQPWEMTAEEAAQVTGLTWDKWQDSISEATKAGKITEDSDPYKSAAKTGNRDFAKLKNEAQKPPPPQPSAGIEKQGKEGKEVSTETIKTAIELPDLRKEDVRSDPRLEMPGITKQSKPNSLIVALRDLESVPVKEIVLKSTGDPIADSKKAEATIRKYAGQQNNVSLRESLAVTTGPNGRAILKFGMSPNGMVWASAKEWIDLVESRNKPIAPGPGAQTVGETQKAQIEQLTDAFKGIEAEKTPLKEQVKEAFAIGEKFSGTKDLFSRALSGLKSSGDWFIQKWKAVPDIDNLLRAKGDLSAQLQANSWRTKKWVQQAMKAIPRKRDQAAIAKWIDAGGDRAELERGMAETLPQYKQAYEDALNLKGDLLVAAQNAQNYFEARLQEAVDAGVLKDGVEDYIHRIYESRPDVEQKVIAHVQDGILKANPALAKKRVFQFDWEAEKLGYKPVQSFITRLAVYESSLARALAAREFIRKATTMKAADGRPVVDIKGVGIPLEDAATGERTGTLIKPQFNPAKANVEGTANYRGDYVNKEFPALSKWKWVSEDAAGKPILVQGDVAIHPDYVHRINALLEPSRVRYGRYGKVLKPAMAVSSTVKQTMLDLSMFHQVQITVHGLEHKVLPWKILQDIDLDNPNVQGLLKGGISLGGEYSPYHAEGLVGASLTRHIPFLGPLTESYHNWLFQSYIPRIKMTMALDALERNRARYKGELTDEQILHKTARQANSAFGELNYVMLERSKTAQDIARLIMLAPDFLEARGRFAAEALTKGGKSTVPGFGNEQRAALLLGALTLYITARMGNKMVNDQYHFEPENAFSIVKDGHAYSLRTVQGDILHLLEKPLQFWMNRLNPVYGRTLLQVATGRDYFGRKRSVPETLWDSVSNMMPIALRSSRERALWESIANSMGMQAKRWSDVDDAFTLAQKWKQKHGIGEKGEFIYDPDKDPLRSLKIALSHGDDAGAAKEIGKLTEGGTKISKLNDYFDRYASMPFTGKASNDRKWEKELTEDERKTVEVAREHKKSIKRLYIKARGQYFSAKNNPQ